jgi:predicted DNA-binding protein (MmcQ/YjbR family)
MQWGSNLVFWAGDKAVGGKMFALVNLELGEHGVISYAAGDRFYELIEHEGIKPAPYMARIFWVAADGWSVWRNSEWEDELRTAYERTFAKLPPRTRTVLALPERERNKIIAARRKELAAQAEAQSEKKAAATAAKKAAKAVSPKKATKTSAKKARVRD